MKRDHPAPGALWGHRGPMRLRICEIISKWYWADLEHRWGRDWYIYQRQRNNFWGRRPRTPQSHVEQSFQELVALVTGRNADET